MIFIISDFIFIFFGLIAIITAFFMFDDIILKGYFATKLRMRFDVEKLKEQK
jgi:hypothetical protein